MISDTYASFKWRTDRKAVMDAIERQIDQLLDGHSTGTFIVDVHGRYGSRNENTKELPAGISAERIKHGN